MIRSLFVLAILAAFATATGIMSPSSPIHERESKKKGKILIPKDTFSDPDTFEDYMNTGYPWGDRHNGKALMKPSQVKIAGNDHKYLQLQSDYIGGNGDLKYNSGTVFAKKPLCIEEGGGLDITASVVAPVGKGTWPAIWLTGFKGWPPESDIVEWKGDGKVYFNTYNMTGGGIKSDNIVYPQPSTAWRNIYAKFRALPNSKTVVMTSYVDDIEIGTQYGDFAGEPFWFVIDYQMLGSSGPQGPTATTYFLVRDLIITSYSSSDLD